MSYGRFYVGFLSYGTDGMGKAKKIKTVSKSIITLWDIKLCLFLRDDFLGVVYVNVGSQVMVWFIIYFI